MLENAPRPIRILLLVLALAAVAAATHVATLYWAAGELVTARANLRQIQGNAKTLAARLDTIQSRRTQAEQEAEVARQANRLLREEEAARQAELHRLQGELDFYRRLAGTSGTQTGLAIYQLELSPSASPRVYRFVLTLTQNLRRSAITTGTVRIALEGSLDDRPVTLPWSLIAGEGEAPPTFRFKYFEQIDGYLALPEGFSPMRAVVSLEAKGQNRPVTRGFEWERLTGPAAGDPVVETPADGADTAH